MPTRLIEVLTSQERLDKVIDCIQSFKPLEICKLTEQEEERVSVRVLIDASHVEDVLEALEPLAETGSDSDDIDKQYRGNRSGTRITVFTVDTMLPPLDESEQGKEKENQAESEFRLNRFELYDRISEDAQLTRYYLLMVALSSIVAAVGLIENNVALIVGAMVIAPLLVPNVALALAVTLADYKLALTASRTGMLGVLIIVLIGLFLGWLLPVDPETPEIASRIKIDELHFLVALAAGVAGALAIAKGVSGGMVGVMVAVALLPPLMVSALLAGSGNWVAAGGALMLYFTNIAAINVAGVVVFLLHKITPKKRWQKAKAQKMAWIVISFWLLLIVALIVGLVVLSDSAISSFR